MTNDWAERFVEKGYYGVSDVEGIKQILKNYKERLFVKPDDEKAKLFDGYNEKNTVEIGISTGDITGELMIRLLNEYYDDIECILFNVYVSPNTKAKEYKEGYPYEKLPNLKEVIGIKTHGDKSPEATEILMSKLLPSA